MPQLQLLPSEQAPTETEQNMVKNLGNFGLGVATDHKGKNDECYTPPEIFESLNLVFDLDVAAPIDGVPWIPAERYYTIHDNGLAQPWHGRVWMNPPFSQIRHFAPLFQQHANGIALVPTSTGRWMHELWKDERTSWTQLSKPRFVRPDGTRWETHMPTVVWLVAMGEESTQALRRLGAVKS